MTSALALLALLAFPQDEKEEDIYATLSLGTRVRVTFHSGNAVIGNLVAPRTRDPNDLPVDKIDYTKINELVIDVSWEYPGLNGTITVRKHEIRELRALQKLDPTTQKRLREEKERVMAALAEREANRDEGERKKNEMGLRARKAARDAAAAAKSVGTESEEIQRQADRLTEGLAIYARFPPPEWGPEKLQVILAKNIRRVPLSLEERQFMEKIQLWTLAHDHRSAAKKPVVAEPAPAPAPPVPAPAPSTTEEKPDPEK